MLSLEAEILANRLCLNAETVERWMKKNGLSSIIDLKSRYPGKSHAECMNLALNEIWESAGL